MTNDYSYFKFVNMNTLQVIYAVVYILERLVIVVHSEGVCMYKLAHWIEVIMNHKSHYESF